MDLSKQIWKVVSTFEQSRANLSDVSSIIIIKCVVTVLQQLSFCFTISISISFQDLVHKNCVK